MDIETRLTNLENLVNSLISSLNSNKFYTDADINGVRQNVSEVEQKMDSVLMPPWDGNGHDYFAGERTEYNGKAYRCIQNHTSQTDWTPEAAPSLWVEIADPSQEWPEWKQPTGAQDAYNKGDKVSHSGKHWISDLDANTWEPGVYGWSESA